MVNHPTSETTLPSIPGGWKNETIPLGDCSIDLTLPAVPDDLLEEEVSASDRSRCNKEPSQTLPDEGAPYWGYLWPAAKTMSQWVLRHPWQAETATLELGCGIGLVGLAALKAGLQTALTDYDQTSIQLAKHNTVKNGYPQAEVIPLQWEFPLQRQFNVILGCEITYEPKSHRALVNLLDQMLTSDGICWLGDGGRRPTADFIKLATSRGYNVSLRDANNQPLTTLQYGNFQLLQIQKTNN